MNLHHQQSDIVARSRAACERARIYATGLKIHLARLNEDRRGAAENGALVGSPGGPEVAAFRSEALVVEKQLDAANLALADLKAEYGRHAADLAAMYGSTETATQKLADTHVAHRAAIIAMEAAAAVLGRAKGHLATAEGKLADAQATERHFERSTAERLQAALRSGADVSWTEAAVPRASLALADDVDTARGLVARLTCEHGVTIEDVAKAAASVDAALDGHLAAEAEVMAVEVEALRQRTSDLRSKLQAFADRPPCHRLSPAKPMLALGRIDGGPRSHALHYPTEAQIRALSSPYRRSLTAAVNHALLLDTALTHGAPQDRESYWRERESELSATPIKITEAEKVAA